MHRVRLSEIEPMTSQGHVSATSSHLVLHNWQSSRGDRQAFRRRRFLARRQQCKRLFTPQIYRERRSFRADFLTSASSQFMPRYRILRRQSSCGQSTEGGRDKPPQAKLWHSVWFEGRRSTEEQCEHQVEARNGRLFDFHLCLLPCGLRTHRTLSAPFINAIAYGAASRASVPCDVFSASCCSRPSVGL